MYHKLVKGLVCADLVEKVMTGRSDQAGLAGSGRYCVSTIHLWGWTKGVITQEQQQELFHYVSLLCYK